MVLRYYKGQFEQLESVAPEQMGLRETWVQDLVAQRPKEVLGERLLVISREYQGFATRERPDILALDENGDVVVIELKRGTAEEDAATQAVKYAAYCSQMDRQRIVSAFEDYITRYEIDTEGASAEETIVDFLGGSGTELEDINRNQKIILVANDFDQRVSAIAVWLYKNHVNLKCVRLRTYRGANGSVLIPPETYLPTPEIESYIQAIAPASEKPPEQPLTTRVLDPFIRGLISSLPQRLKSEPFNSQDVEVYPRGDDFRVKMFGKNRAGYYFAKRWLRFYLYRPSEDEITAIREGVSDSGSVSNRTYDIGFNVRTPADLDLVVMVLEKRFDNQGEAPVTITEAET